MKNIQKGIQGEYIALNYLRMSGYEIIHSNYRYKKYQIDIICKYNNILILIEVKYRTNLNYGIISLKQLHHLIEYISILYEQSTLAVQLDVILIDKNHNIQHIKNVCIDI